MAKTNMNKRGKVNNFLSISRLPTKEKEFDLQSLLFRGLILNSFEFQFEQNCPIAAVNASHFLPYKLSISKINFRRVL